MTYSSTGTIIIDANNALNDEDIIFAIESALAAELDIHPSNLHVSFDSENGIITYAINSDDIDLVSNAITAIGDDDFVSNLDIGEEISINSVEIQNDITMTIDVVVNASNVVDANVAVNDATESIQNYDSNYQITNQGTHKSFFRSHCT